MCLVLFLWQWPLKLTLQQNYAFAEKRLVCLCMYSFAVCNIYVCVCVWTNVCGHVCVCMHMCMCSFLLKLLKPFFASKFNVVCARWHSTVQRSVHIWKEKKEKRRYCKKYSHHSWFRWLNYWYYPEKVYSECHTVQNPHRASPPLPPPPPSQLSFDSPFLSPLYLVLLLFLSCQFFPAKSLLPHMTYKVDWAFKTSKSLTCC